MPLYSQKKGYKPEVVHFQVCQASPSCTGPRTQVSRHPSQCPFHYSLTLLGASPVTTWCPNHQSLQVCTWEAERWGMCSSGPRQKRKCTGTFAWTGHANPQTLSIRASIQSLCCHLYLLKHTPAHCPPEAASAFQEETKEEINGPREQDSYFLKG